MSTLNRREMIQRSAACGVGAVIGEAAFSEQALGDDASSAQRASGVSPIRFKGTVPPNAVQKMGSLKVEKVI